MGKLLSQLKIDECRMMIEKRIVFHSAICIHQSSISKFPADEECAEQRMIRHWA
jgi:hypothetical protein